MLPRNPKPAEWQKFVNVLAGLLKESLTSNIPKTVKSPYDAMMRDWIENFDWKPMAKEIMMDYRKKQRAELYDD